MTIRLHVACSPGEIRVAAVQDGRLLDYALWRPGAPDGLGDLHRGRIDAVMPALGGAFVALAGHAAAGFLPLGGLTTPGVGDPILVRVSRSAQGGKGPRLALADPADAEHRGPPALLSHGPDPLTTLAATYPDAAILIDDQALANRLTDSLRARLTVVAASFDAELETEIADLASAAVTLPGGLRASIHPTPALVAIDVDTGSASGARATKQTAQFAANRLAIGPLLHQIRLRNLSGAILIDLAGLPARKRAALRPDIEQALAQDPLQPRLMGFTALGLVEILRPRGHPPLHELLAGPHAAGLAALRAAAAQVARPPHRLPTLTASLAIALALERDRAARESLAWLAGQPISIRPDASLPDLAWTFDDA